MHIFTLLLQAGWQHTEECHGDVGSPPVLSPWKQIQAQLFSRLEFTVKSLLMEPHTPSQAALGRSVLSCMDVGQNAAFSQQRGAGALDL